jgi:uncharacterized protein
MAAASASATGESVARQGLRPYGVRAAPAGLRVLAVFVILSYGFSWAWMLPLAVAGDVIEKGSGWPTHLPALLGPALAALVVTAWVSGRAGLVDLVARMGRWRMPARWWAATLSPLLFLALALAIAAAAGDFPGWDAFGRYSGSPTLGVVGVAVIVLIGALGEETGWRGFALPLLQRRYSPLAAALLITPIWAAWHLPLFLTVSGYRGFAPAAYVGFVFSLGCGSLVLNWLYNGSGGSILACVVWHGLFNIATATAAGSGTIAAVVSTLVIAQALVLLGLELRARKRGWPSVLGGGGAGCTPTHATQGAGLPAC